MAMRKLRTGDHVVVITGSDKGKRGAIARVVDDNRVIVQGVKLVKKHQRPIPQRNIAGGITEKEMPIHVSNVAIVNPQTGKADRVGVRFEDGQKIRYFKSNNERIDAIERQ